MPGYFGTGQGLRGLRVFGQMQRLPVAGGVQVGIRVGPLVDRVGRTGSEMEGAHVAFGRGEVDVLGRTFQRVVVGQTGLADVRDHVHGALGGTELLQHHDGGHMAGRLVGVGAAQDQGLAAGFLAFQHVDVHVAEFIRQIGVVGGELFGPGHGRSFRHDIFHEVALLAEAHPGVDRHENGDGQDNAGTD